MLNWELVLFVLIKPNFFSLSWVLLFIQLGFCSGLCIYLKTKQKIIHDILTVFVVWSPIFAFTTDFPKSENYNRKLAIGQFLLSFITGGSIVQKTTIIVLSSKSESIKSPLITVACWYYYTSSSSQLNLSFNIKFQIVKPLSKVLLANCGQNRSFWIPLQKYFFLLYIYIYIFSKKISFVG